MLKERAMLRATTCTALISASGRVTDVVGWCSSVQKSFQLEAGSLLHRPQGCRLA